MQIIFLKFIAVYSSYRHLFNKKSTTIFIKLEVRWAGEKGRSTFWNDFSNQHSHWYPRSMTWTLPSQMAESSLLQEEQQQEGDCCPPAGCSTPLCSLCVSQTEFWEKELPLSPLSYSEWTVLSFKEEEEQEQLLRSKAGRWDWRAAQTQWKKTHSCPIHIYS